MNKTFSRIIFSFALAFAMLIPMFATNASAQTSTGVPRTQNEAIFIARINQQVTVLNNVMLQAETLFGPTRVLLLTGTLLGFTPDQLQLQAGAFGITLNDFVVSTLIARELNIPVTRVIQLSTTGRTFGQIALGFGVPLNVTVNSIRNFIDVFTIEIGISNGDNGGTTTDDELMALLTRLFDLLNTRLDTLQVRLGNVTFEAILIARLSVETNTPIDVLTSLRAQFNTLEPNNFAIRALLASSISAVSLQRLQDMGFVFEEVNVVTPLGAGRALGAFGIPVQVFVARVDTFLRLVRSDASGTTDAGNGAVIDPGA